MPTIITHALVPIAIAVAAGPNRISPKLMAMGVALSLLPNADVIGFSFGIQYGDEWGHRGASHSIMFALLIAGAVSILWNEVRSTWAFAFLALCAASHGLLDTLTNGGLGIALLWPYDLTRFFAPQTPILVSPIGMNFFSMRGFATLASEAIWIWVPLGLIAGIVWVWRRRSYRAQ